MINTLCFSGGAIKGISFIGAIQELIKLEYFKLENINKLVGCSIGSLIAVLITLGYNMDELYNITLNYNFSKVEPRLELDKFICYGGFNDGIYIFNIIKKFLKNKNFDVNINLKQLYNLTNKELVFITTNFTHGKEEPISYKTHPNLPLTIAFRMSCSIPLVFTPVYYNNNFYVDGGLTCNFPIEYCDKNTTIGFVIHNEKYYKFDTISNYLKNYFSIVSKNISFNQFKKSQCKDYKIVIIKTKFDKKTFKVNNKDVDSLINDGIEAVKIFSNHSYNA
jgi:NTE family protein